MKRKVRNFILTWKLITAQDHKDQGVHLCVWEGVITLNIVITSGKVIGQFFVELQVNWSAVQDLVDLQSL